MQLLSVFLGRFVYSSVHKRKEKKKISKHNISPYENSLEVPFSWFRTTEESRCWCVRCVCALGLACVCVLCQNSLRGVQAINSADQPVFVTCMQEVLHMLCTHGSALNPIPYPFQNTKMCAFVFPQYIYASVKRLTSYSKCGFAESTVCKKSKIPQFQFYFLSSLFIFR